MKECFAISHYSQVSRDYVHPPSWMPCERVSMSAGFEKCSEVESSVFSLVPIEADEKAESNGPIEMLAGVHIVS